MPNASKRAEIKFRFIYGLIHPETGVIRYVGKSCETETRVLQRHIRDGKNNIRTKKARWVKGLLNRNLLPLITTIESRVCGVPEINAQEVYWIQELAGNGLVNGSKGGDGGSTVDYNTFVSKWQLMGTKTIIPIRKKAWIVARRNAILNEMSRFKKYGASSMKNAIRVPTKCEFCNRTCKSYRSRTCGSSRCVSEALTLSRAKFGRIQINSNTGEPFIFSHPMYACHYVGDTGRYLYRVMRGELKSYKGWTVTYFYQNGERKIPIPMREVTGLLQ